MGVNLFNAFKSINEDKNWIIKTLVGGVLISICVFMNLLPAGKTTIAVIVLFLTGCYLAGVLCKGFEDFIDLNFKRFFMISKENQRVIWSLFE